MVFDRTKSYDYEDIDESLITHDEYVMSVALDMISIARNIPREQIAQWLLDTYGGSLENAIINAFINLDWKKFIDVFEYM